MDRAVTDLQQIPFEQLIGSPMKAAVQAQALAAQSTIEFIQKVGFKSADGVTPPDMLFKDPSQNAEAGEVRNVSFTYEKKDEDGTLGQFELTVPLLAIAPIPYLRIDEMTIDFSAKLTDAIERKTESAFELNTSVSGGYSAFWSPVKVEFRASATYNTKDSTTSSSKREYRLDIHVRAVQDEMPAGLEKVLNILEDAIQNTKAT